MFLKKITGFFFTLISAASAFAAESAGESAVDAAADIAIKTTQGVKNEIVNMLNLNALSSYLTWGNLAKVITSVIAILIFYIVYRLIRHFVVKASSKNLKPATVRVLSKAVSYVFYVIIVMYILGLFGINLSAVWGAAGIAGVAIGFAAQTSVSNLISGVFVLTDKAMRVGDFIEVDGISGTVDQVGIISVKEKTLDNQMIRIPNSTIINSKLINYSTHEYRRYVFDLSVDYGTDLDKAIEVLKTVPARCPTVITNRADLAPAAFCTTLGDSGIGMNLVVWCKRTDFIQTKGDVCRETVKTLNENGINIPFNRLDVTLLNENTVPAVNLKA